jgi:hypothetical protein
MGLLQLIGWLAYPLWFPLPLLVLNCVAAWRLQRGQDAYRALQIRPPIWHLARVWLAVAVLAVTAYVVVGLAVLAWQVGVLLLVWIGIPAAVTVANLAAMRRLHRASDTNPGQDVPTKEAGR